MPHLPTVLGWYPCIVLAVFQWLQIHDRGKRHTLKYQLSAAAPAYSKCVGFLNLKYGVVRQPYWVGCEMLAHGVSQSAVTATSRLTSNKQQLYF